MIGLFRSGARKAQVAAVIGFLGPLGTYVAAEGDWSWRAFGGAVITGMLAGLATYNAPYEPTPGTGNQGVV